MRQYTYRTFVTAVLLDSGCLAIFSHTYFSIIKKKGLNGRSRAEAFFSQKENCFSQIHAETQKMFYRSIVNHRRLDYRKQSSRPLDFKDCIL